MKVYIVTKTAFPNGMAPANRIKCYAQALKSQNVDVEILIYTRTEVFGENPKNIKGDGLYEGIRYKYIGGTPLRNKNAIIRKYHDYKDKKDCLDYLRKKIKKDDVVFAYSGQDVDYIIKIINLTHLLGAKFYRDLCEFPYGTANETRQTKAGREKTLKKQIPLCDGVVCISKALCDYISPYSKKSAKNIIVPILVDFKRYEVPDYSCDSEFQYIFHAGSLTEQKDGVLGMLEAFGMASKSLDASIKFILTGNLEKANAAAQIKSIIKKYSIEDRVLFTGYLSENELKDRLSKASLVIINKYVTQQNKYCFSTKLGEYLSAGKPVIITRVGEAMNWLKNEESAYIVDPDDTYQLSSAIIDAFSNPEKRNKIAIGGKEICRRFFDYNNWGPVLVNLFMGLY